MSPDGAVVATACALSTSLCLRAASDRDPAAWLAAGATVALFGVYKLTAEQAFVIAHLRALAHGEGWYGDRHVPQWAAMGVVLAGAAAGVAASALAMRRQAFEPRLALCLAAALTGYALLGMISLHAWDRLVSRAVANVPAYTLIEVALPSLIALCAVVRRTHGGAR